uniref:Glycolipid transfer protein n=1 Tax=Solanum tuberosum TaxID=4113 RepID=M1BS32_SOLTU
MDFLVALFRNLLEHQDWAMSQACSDSYSKTLKKWHGWIASSSFTVTVSYTLKISLLKLLIRNSCIFPHSSHHAKYEILPSLVLECVCC